MQFTNFYTSLAYRIVTQPYSLLLILNCLFFSEFQENQAMKCHHNNEHGRIQTKYKQVTITWKMVDNLTLPLLGKFLPRLSAGYTLSWALVHRCRKWSSDMEVCNIKYMYNISTTTERKLFFCVCNFYIFKLICSLTHYRKTIIHLHILTLRTLFSSSFFN